MNPADALSRHPLHRLSAVSLVQTTPELLKEFADAYELDPLYSTEDSPASRTVSLTSHPDAGPSAPGRIGSQTSTAVRSTDCHKRGSLWYKEGQGTYQVCVPNRQELRHLVIREAHDAPVGAHFAVQKGCCRSQPSR